MAKAGSTENAAATPDESQPALPWAASRSGEVPKDASRGDGMEDNADEDMGVDDLKGALAAACPLEAVGLQVNDKIEVKWEVESENGTIVTRWWGARVLHLDESQTAGGVGKVWVVMYDPFGSFSAEQAKIIFLSERHIFDVSEGVEMRWRKEGELLGDTEFDEDGAEMKTLSDIIEEGELAGLSEEKCAELEHTAMQKLPIANQQALAAGFQEFKDSLVRFLKRKEEELGEHTVIGEKDVADFVAEMSKKSKRK
ncbi:unnamed protein product [Ostreobium quekettii]|uniref:Uncharacterized protein n=1 Tax=Ostreobium quekettii TaxID=121088 RepID=A0A8S1JC78_9CHLO|nr:unnamed protein product [Ostreobium quekettii]|eukprot:evm.model.scf_2521.1 EVM.evm.TU.scf_2521.1   scf_2521:9031-14373(+)